MENLPTTKVDTSKQYDKIIERCRNILIIKNKDYKASWHILRLTSITDQIWIKAQRIRSIEEKGVQKIDEGIDGEFIGIINYSIIALIQLERQKPGDLYYDSSELTDVVILKLFNSHVQKTKELMFKKNHDYGEAWREMRVCSMTDLILMKLLRVKQIEDNKGQTNVSEGVDANYMDIINYSIFALIKMGHAD